jgi:hypothetical protein
MTRRSSDQFETAAVGFVGVALLIAAVVVAVIAIVLVAMVKELWRIFKAHARTPGPASRILWAALACLCALLLIAGVLASNSTTMTYGVALASWSVFVFVLVCELADRRFKPAVVPVPKQLSLADVVSWEKPSQQLQPVSIGVQETARGHTVSKAA